VPFIRWRIISLALEHMAQVPTTITAHDLCPLHTKRAVSVPCHRAGDAVKVRRPAAATLELMVGLVERRGAGGA
jgi:hypothetical protein